MITEWFKGLNPEERKKREDLVRSSKELLDILSEILYNRDKGLRASVLSDYDTPSWAFKQAHLNGRRDELRQLMRLCQIDNEDRPEPRK